MSKITNLIGTTWRLDASNLDSVTSDYGVFNITSYGKGIVEGFLCDCISSKIYVGFVGAGDGVIVPHDSIITVFYDEVFTEYEGQQVTLNNINFPYGGDDVYGGYYEFTITGGADISNPLFIDFINTYGTLVSGGEPEVPTAEGVKEKLQSLLIASNAKTGKSDATLTDAVKTLLEGYKQGEDSPLPIEVSTEAEMTALLSTAEVGAIYKYTGETTDTYENGALYVVEETDTIIGTWKVKEGERALLPAFDIRVSATGSFSYKAPTSSKTTTKTLVAIGSVYSSIGTASESKALGLWLDAQCATVYSSNGQIRYTADGGVGSQRYDYTAYPNAQIFTITSIDTTDANYPYIKEWVETYATRIPS